VFFELHRHPTWLEGHGVPCFFHQFTGLYCPGCGGTRAVILLSRGDILGALRMNPFTLTLIAAVAASLIHCLVRGRGINYTGKNGRGGVAIASFVLAFFVLRNIPVAPFTYLAPRPLKEASNPTPRYANGVTDRSKVSRSRRREMSEANQEVGRDARARPTLVTATNNPNQA
jgi:hypothetical protein